MAAAPILQPKVFLSYSHDSPEEIWGRLGRPGMLIRAPWPVPELQDAWPRDVESAEAVLRLITAIRRIRSEARVEPRATVSASVKPLALEEGLRRCEPVIRRMANLESLSWDGEVRDGATVAVDPAFQVAVELGEANLGAERDRLRKELEDAERRLENVRKRLANPQFVANAKPEIVDGARTEERELQVLRDTLQARLRDLGS